MYPCSEVCAREMTHNRVRTRKQVSGLICCSNAVLTLSTPVETGIEKTSAIFKQEQVWQPEIMR